MDTSVPQSRVQLPDQAVAGEIFAPAGWDRAFMVDVVWRFQLLHDAGFADADHDEYIRQAEGSGGAMLGRAVADDVTRFRRCLSADHPAAALMTIAESHLLGPLRTMTAAVNTVYARLKISPCELLVTSLLADSRFAAEAVEQAGAYWSMKYDMAAPARLLTTRIELISRDATGLAGPQRRVNGWHTSAAELWLRLRHLAAYAYPLMPCFGLRLWDALRLSGLPMWPSPPASRAVRPAPLPETLLEVPSSWNGRIAAGAAGERPHEGGPIRISELDRDLVRPRS